MNSLPPTFNSAIFNTNAFSSGGFLTKSQADLLYAPYSSVAYLSLLYGVTPGIISASKAVIVDSNRDITNFRNITATGTISASTLTGTTFTLSGIQTSTNTTTSTSSSTGALLLSGGIGIGLSTDATSSTNGGSFTTSGGMAVAKKVYIGSDLAVSGNTILSGSLSSATINSETIMNSKITNTLTGTINYPLQIQHLLSSGSPTNNSFGVGLKFQMPNSINNTVDYGAIDAVIQQNSSGLQQGQLNFYTTFAGSLVNAMTLSSLTSPTNNVLVLNGATSLFSAYRLVCDNVLCNSNILINKATLPNLTIQSTSSSSLSQLLLVTDNQTWELGARGSTANNPNSFYLYNSGYMYTITNTGITKFFNTAVSTTSTSNAFQLSGGLYASKAILNNSYYNCNTINNNATSHSVSNQAICLNNHAIYFQGQNASNTDSGIMYSKNSNWNSGNGWASANQDGPVLYGNQSVIIGNLNNSNTETSCAIFSGTTTSLLGTVNINTPPATPSRVNIQSFGTQLGLINNANGYAYLSSDSQGGFTITTNNPLATPTYQTYLQYCFDSTWPSGTAGQNTRPRLSLSGYPCPSTTGDNFRLYFGNTAADIILCLYNANNLSPSYGFGANNSALQYLSAGSGGHKFYYNSSSGLGTPTQLGANIFNIQGNGNVVSQRNMFSGAGVHAFGYDTADLGSYGDGVHLHYAGGHGSVFAYNYSAGSYRDIGFNNNNLYIRSANGYVGIQQTSPVCPLHVSTTANQTTAATFGWLSTVGSGVATAFTNRAFSIRSDGGIYVVTGEIDCTSDVRFKENINEIDDQLALDFITKIKPIVFSYKNANKNLHYGYSAQELVKNRFSVLVGSTQTDEPMDEQVLIDGQGETITIPSDTKLIVNLLATIPLLHRALQLVNERITILEKHLEPQSQSKVEFTRAKKVKKPIVYKR